MRTIRRLWLKKDQKMANTWRSFILAADLVPDEEVDYCIGIFEEDTLIATGAIFQNIIKEVAVLPNYQSENLFTVLMGELMAEMRTQGRQHIFAYTKPANEAVFHALGFRTITKTQDVLFLEEGQPNLSTYLKELATYHLPGENSAIVMNANPFTKGHQGLVAYAATHSDHVYVFVLSEDRSEFSFADRVEMVRLGTEQFENVTVLSTKEYMVSSATFPSYFLKEQATLFLAKIQAIVDATLFKDQIAPMLSIKKRYVGEEPYSKVTEVYNQAMQSTFGSDLTLQILPRISISGEVISATKVRQALHEHDLAKINKFLPATSYKYLEEHNRL